MSEETREITTLEQLNEYATMEREAALKNDAEAAEAARKGKEEAAIKVLAEASKILANCASMIGKVEIKKGADGRLMVNQISVKLPIYDISDILQFAKLVAALEVVEDDENHIVLQWARQKDEK